MASTATVADPTLLATRFQLDRVLGEGANGRVYEAVDTLTGLTVALKTLRSRSPEEVYRLKREFRMLSGLHHRNLVKLHDLIVDENVCFFTMERLSGLGFCDWVRNASSIQTDDANSSSQRLRRALREVVMGLSVLHAAGKLHRDIKPSNVMVEPDGRAVLLDFGFAAPREVIGAAAGESGFAGTLGYMAPEVLREARTSTASDWYGVGVIAYEALSGHLPFEINPADLSAALSPDRPAPEPLRTSCPELPEELEDLIHALLSADPQQRPGAREIYGSLTKNSESEAPPKSESLAPFVGRAYELTLLEEAWGSSSAETVFLEVEGESGVGKSTLVGRFLDDLVANDRAVVLRGRCHTQETLAFRALDAVVDQLSDVIMRLDELPGSFRRRLVAAARLFPVLNRVLARGGDEPRLLDAQLAIAPQAPELRKRAISSLRELFKDLAAIRPIAIWIDDAQWMDRDSTELLEELLGDSPIPRMMIMLTRRSFDRETAKGQLPFVLPDAIARRRVELGPLARNESLELIRLLEPDGEGTRESFRSLAEESGGNPFLLGELARSYGLNPTMEVGAGLNDLMTVRAQGLSEVERSLLEIATVAGQPIEFKIVAAALGQNAADQSGLRSLCGQSWLRADGPDDEPWVDVFHDRIREGLAGQIDPDRRKLLHFNLARTLENANAPDPTRLVHHYLEAGEGMRAADSAFRAAEFANRALAFHRTVELYQIALDHGTQLCARSELLSRIGEALAHAGRSKEAAERLLESARELEAIEGGSLREVELRILAAEHLLRSGHPQDGMATFQIALAGLRIRIPSSIPTAIGQLLWSRAMLAISPAAPDRKVETAFSAVDRLEMQALWSAGIGLAGYAPIVSAALHAMYKRRASRSGVARYLGRSLAAESTIYHLQGGNRNRERGELLAEEAERIARTGSNPAELAHVLMSRSANACFANRWTDAVALGREAEEVCRDQGVGGGWELMNAQTFRILALSVLGRFEELKEELPRFLREASGRGDSYAGINARLGHVSIAWLAMDDPDEAQKQASEALKLCPTDRFSTQHYLSVYGLCQIDLYRRKPELAWERLVAAWPKLRNNGMLGLEAVRIDMRQLRGRVAIALAAGTGTGTTRDTRKLRVARSEAKRISREDAPWSKALAAALRAGILSLEKRNTEAAELLEFAGSQLDALHVRAFADSARLQASRLREDTSVAAMLASLSKRGAENPHRMADMLVPVLLPGAQ